MGADEFQDMSKNDLVREVLRLRGVLEQQMSAAPGIGDEVVVEGIVGVMTGLPIVTMRAGEAAWQFTPAQAREHALATLERAIEAERDAAVITGLRDYLGEGAAAAMVALIREKRPQVVHRVVEERFTGEG